MNLISSKEVPDTIYCHFTHKVAPNDTQGIFSTALYVNHDTGKQNVLGYTTARKSLQGTDSKSIVLQSYGYALHSIYQWQQQLLARGITNVILVTDNPTLHKWLSNLDKCKHKDLVYKARKDYDLGGIFSLYVDVTLGDIIKKSGAKRYCRKEFVSSKRSLYSNADAKSIGDILNESPIDLDDILKER